MKAPPAHQVVMALKVPLMGGLAAWEVMVRMAVRAVLVEMAAMAMMPPKPAAMAAMAGLVGRAALVVGG
jgi:hypothetical protein